MLSLLKAYYIWTVWRCLKCKGWMLWWAQLLKWKAISLPRNKSIYWELPSSHKLQQRQTQKSLNSSHPHGILSLYAGLKTLTLPGTFLYQEGQEKTGVEALCSWTHIIPLIKCLLITPWIWKQCWEFTYSISYKTNSDTSERGILTYSEKAMMAVKGV